jgi:NADH:ubiquinone oxidoreductase subunit 6 (subunit J)
MEPEFGRLPDKVSMAEHFGNQMQTKVSDIVVSITLLLLSIMILGMSYWLYQKDKSLVILLVCAVFVLYTAQQLMMIITVKKFLRPTAFKVYFGTAIAFMTLFTIIAGFVGYMTFGKTDTQSGAPAPFAAPPVTVSSDGDL